MDIKRTLPLVLLVCTFWERDQLTISQQDHQPTENDTSSSADPNRIEGLATPARETWPGSRWSSDDACPPESDTETSSGHDILRRACAVTRAQMLVYAVRALARETVLTEIEGCAADDRCKSWRLCSESQTSELREEDWEASFIGWAMEPPRRFFRGDGQPGPGESRTCRPDDPALWIEVATLFVRMGDSTKEQSPARAAHSSWELANEYDRVRSLMSRGYELESVVDSDKWWTPAVVVFNNLGLTCMPKTSDGKRTADICNSGDLARCYLTRPRLAAITDRIRGSLPRRQCDPIQMTPPT